MVENFSNIQAVLNEFRVALREFRNTGKNYTVYVEKTGLSEAEQIELMETLGRGHVTIRFDETDQPVEWYESQFSGIWIGVYKNGRDDSILHTIEVGRFPEVIGAFPEDMEVSEEELQDWITAADI